MVLISWIPISIVIFIKQSHEMYLNMKLKRDNARKVRPIFRQAVEETVPTEIDFTPLKKLKEKSEEQNPKTQTFNPREIKFKDTKT